MLSPHAPEFARDLGFESVEEKQALHESTIAIAGLGGAGFPLGINLARHGVGRIIAAEFDPIGRTNFNRHPGAFRNTEGVNKLDVFAETVHQINPAIEVVSCPEGVTPDNVDDFVGMSDLVFDGIDFNSPWASAMLHRTARKYGKPALTGLEVGNAAIITSFHPDGVTFEKINGLSETASIDELRETSDGPDLSRALPYIPITSTDISVMKAVQKGAPLPSNVIGVELFGSLATHEALKHLTARVDGPHVNGFMRLVRGMMGTQMVGNNRPAPTWAPKYRVVDLDRNLAKTVKASQANFYRQALLFEVRSRLGMNPAANYDHEIPPQEAPEE